MVGEVGERLQVYLGTQQVGEIERRGPGRYRFSYSSAALTRRSPGGIQLSASLPPRAEVFTPSETSPFFEGLLPEGAVRTAIARSFRISEEDGFGLLRALGADCAGAVTVLPPDHEPPVPGPGSLRALSDEQLVQLVADLPHHPLGVDPTEAGVRLSLGGIQHKLVLAGSSLRGFSQPLEGAPSTCLLKPEFGQYPGLVVNEAFCMKVARSTGLRTAFANEIEVGSTPCLYVERFDREFDADGNAIRRVHQEDMCQALGVSPVAKYEDNGGPSIADIIRLLRTIRGPFMARDVNEFIHAVLINFLLGNSDAHGKNFALLYEPRAGVRLAPVYDIVSTAVYPEVTDRMAMAIGGVTDPKEVDLEAWMRLAEECELGRGIGAIVRRRVGAVKRAVLHWQESAVRDGWHQDVVDEIAEICRRRAGQLRGS